MRGNIRVALIKAPYMDIWSSVREAAAEMFPLGLGYLASYLIKNEIEVMLVDPDIEDTDYNGVIQKISGFKPHIVGISAMTSNFFAASRLAKDIKNMSNTIIILGGAHASAVPSEIVSSFREFDAVVFGEGEETLLEICNKYVNGKVDFSDISGVCYRENDLPKKNKPRPFIENIDTIPYPARDLVNIKKYKSPNYLEFGKTNATMITSRGCPNQCTFCSAHLSTGYKYRPHSIDYVLGEIQLLIEKYNTEFILFWDDTFTINKKRVLELCEAILDRKLKFSWFCLARVNTVDEETLSIMKKAGLRVINCGVESGNQEILNNIKKGTSLEQIKRAYKIARKLKLKTLASFMFGLPGETKETIENTIDFAVELDPDMAFFFILTPFPGSAIYGEYKDKLFNVSENWSDFKYVLTDGTIALESREFTKEELKSYLVEANRRFFMRPKFLAKQLIRIRSFDELKANLTGAITLFKQMRFISPKGNKT